MYLIEKDVVWEMGHRLTRHQGKCFNLHGHSYKAVITLGADTLDADGMVVDFYHFRKIKDFIDARWDHALMLNQHDPLAKIIPTLVEGRPLKFWLVPDEPTAENIAHWLCDAIKSIFSSELEDGRVKVVDVTIYETATSSATYFPEG